MGLHERLDVGADAAIAAFNRLPRDEQTRLAAQGGQTDFESAHADDLAAEAQAQAELARAKERAKVCELNVRNLRARHAADTRTRVRTVIAIVLGLDRIATAGHRQRWCVDARASRCDLWLSNAQTLTAHRLLPSTPPPSTPFISRSGATTTRRVPR